jgi:hypothetical protein
VRKAILPVRQTPDIEGALNVLQPPSKFTFNFNELQNRCFECALSALKFAFDFNELQMLQKHPSKNAV